MAVQSDRAGYVEIEEWINGRPSWLRAAARGLIRDRRPPTETEINTLADHCRAEAEEGLKAPEPMLPPGVILGAAGRPDLRIKSISEINGVNALGGAARLELAGADLTIVYGGNGSGKSGYARLMKHLCGVRVQGPMHGNVFEPESESPSAQVAWSMLARDGSGAVDEARAWNAKNGPLKPLNGVPVFDSATAVELGDSSNPATYAPRTMRFVGALIRVSDLVCANLKARAAMLITPLPTPPVDVAHTSAVALLRQLKVTTALAAIDEACGFTEALRLERVALEAALAQADPATAHAKAVSDLNHLEKQRELAIAWEEALGDAKATELLTTRSDALARRAAASTYAASFFEGMPLPSVGEAAWRLMWEAAEQYAQENAYPGHSHPNVEDGARCVLCQQVLEDDAKARLQRFSDYVGNQLQAQAATAELALAARVGAFPKSPSADQWLAQTSIVGMEPAAAEALWQAIDARLTALATATELHELPLVQWEPWRLAFAAKKGALTSERNALAALLDPTGRLQKETRLHELRGSEWLSAQRAYLIAEVERLKECATLNAAIRLAATNQLTSKSNEIGQQELAQGFCKRFNYELRELGGNAIPVEMTHRSEGKGNFTFIVRLLDPKRKVLNREVLSEGEQRVVALAAFLADVTGADRSLPVIFDDPISSLDQRFEEAVAARLARLAGDRQVIVFTHRLSLMVLLENASEKQTCSIQTVAITRDGKSTGIPATIDAFSTKPKKGLNQLISTMGAVKKQDLAIRRMAMKDACSTFRILVERSVEDHLCAGVVGRFRREIRTVGLLPKLAAIEPSDCAFIDAMMTKYSAFEHSQSPETPTWMPEPDELLGDATEMVKWIDSLMARQAG